MLWNWTDFSFEPISYQYKKHITLTRIARRKTLISNRRNESKKEKKEAEQRWLHEVRIFSSYSREEIEKSTWTEPHEFISFSTYLKANISSFQMKSTLHTSCVYRKSKVLICRNGTLWIVWLVCVHTIQYWILSLTEVLSRKKHLFRLFWFWFFCLFALDAQIKCHRKLELLKDHHSNSILDESIYDNHIAHESSE